MQIVIPGLYASAPEPLPFAAELEIRAFLLAVYGVGAVAADVQSIEDLGGISRHYRNHWHEAQFGCDRIASTFKAPLVCHEDDRQSVAETCEVAQAFSGRHRLEGDFEVIPTPGHTPGATAFLWDSGRHRCLFTGDTIYLRDGDRIAAVLESSHRDAYIESFERLKELDFDMLVPWSATAGQPFHAVTDQTDARRRIDAIVERLRQGADH